MNNDTGRRRAAEHSTKAFVLFEDAEAIRDLARRLHQHSRIYGTPYDPSFNDTLRTEFRRTRAALRALVNGEVKEPPPPPSEHQIVNIRLEVGCRRYRVAFVGDRVLTVARKTKSGEVALNIDGDTGRYVISLARKQRER